MTGMVEKAEQEETPSVEQYRGGGTDADTPMLKDGTDRQMG